MLFNEDDEIFFEFFSIRAFVALSPRWRASAPTWAKSETTEPIGYAHPHYDPFLTNETIRLCNFLAFCFQAKFVAKRIIRKSFERNSSKPIYN